MNAKPGDLVECIDDKPSREGLPVMVTKGQIYLVKGVCISGQSKRPAYMLEGVMVPGEPTQFWPQSQYRFKKLDPDGLKKSWQEMIQQHKPVIKKVKEDA